MADILERVLEMAKSDNGVRVPNSYSYFVRYCFHIKRLYSRLYISSRIPFGRYHIAARCDIGNDNHAAGEGSKIIGEYYRRRKPVE